MSMREVEFHTRYIPEPNSGCWLWDGTPFGAMGYGYFRYKGSVVAHRASWRIHNGEIPSGIFVCHKCDNPACVNPDHLYLGTAKDNVRDREVRGRTRGFVGENASKTHCKNGHEFTPENTKMRNGVWRTCRRCDYLGTKRLREKKKAARDGK